MEIQPDDNHVDFSDLPTLPPGQIRVLGHVIRNPDIRLSDLIAVFEEAADGESINAEEITAILSELEKKHLLNTSKRSGETTYRARMRRKTSQVMTIQGIWNALDSEELEGGMHKEMRRARSDLADSLLADMSKEEQYNFNAPPPDPEQAKQTGASLLSDLMDAGRSSMSKREGVKERPDKKPMGRILQDDIAAKSKKERNPVIDDLAATLQKQTGIHPVANMEEEEKTGLWRRLLGWLGR